VTETGEFISFSGGGCTVSCFVSATDFRLIETGAECWVRVWDMQSRDEEGRTVQLGEGMVLFRDGTVAGRTQGTPERP
jgi:hypothetical protein